MAMTRRLWSLSALGVEFSIDRRAVAKALRSYPPDGKLKGHPAWFMSTAAVALVGDGAEEDKLDLTQERARLAREQAEMAKIKRLAMEERYLDADDVVSGWQATISRFRSRMLGFPSTVAQECVVRARDGEQAVRTYLKAEVDSALAELSRVTFEADVDDDEELLAA